MQLESEYIALEKRNIFPRIPFHGSLDITYQCNNNCRHCWLRISPNSKERKRELSLDEIRGIVNNAKKMGCFKWSIFGGEPMIRKDFPDIFEYITVHSKAYSINTNGTFITPRIARLMKKKGAKMIALYGATAEVHDHVTRNPCSFELTMRGFAYLKEAGADFIVQIIPMKDNLHQLGDMIDLAKSISKDYRIGATWLYLAACGNSRRNKEIIQQRLLPKEVVKLDNLDSSCNGLLKKDRLDHNITNANDNLFASCISLGRDFSVDPYGQMTFCSFIKDSRLRYDLRKGSFEECWESFIPSLSNKVKATKEYKENCGCCEFRGDCGWCPVYGYLEHRRFDTRIKYLCNIAMEKRKIKENWKREHRRSFDIAGVTMQIESNLAMKENTFHSKFKYFESTSPGEDVISIRHYFSLPDLNGRDLGREYYRKPPWAVYKKGDSWIYLGIFPTQDDRRLHRVAVFNSDHTRARIYSNNNRTFLKGNLQSLTLLPTDLILLARILADRQGCCLHACGVNFKERGLLFAGSSGAGKSTMANMFKGKAEILCDDRIIIRRWPDGFKIHGTWNHGEVPDISSKPVSLEAILFLKKARENKLIPLTDKKEIIKQLLNCLIKPFVTKDWWGKTLILIERIADYIPCYILEFNKDGMVVDVLNEAIKVNKKKGGIACQRKNGENLT